MIGRKRSVNWNARASPYSISSSLSFSPNSAAPSAFPSSEKLQRTAIRFNPKEPPFRLTISPPPPAPSSTAGGTKFLCFTRQRIMPRLSIPLILDDNERNVILRPVMLQARDSFIPRIRARGMILPACRLCLVNEIQRRAA